MPSRKSRVLLSAGFPLLVGLLASCGPKGPEAGTPAFSWAVAQETFAAGDHLKTTEHLRRVIRTENEFTERALPWRLVVSSGIAQAYLDLASDCQMGLSANPQREMALRQALLKYRREAETRSLEFTETFIQFRKVHQGQTVGLEFRFPPVRAADILERGTLQGGSLPSEEIMALVENRMIGRAVAEAAAAAVGAPGDIAKGRLAFQGGRAETPREVFMQVMVRSLLNQTKLFGREALGKPDRLMMLAEHGTEALKTMEASKQNKELAQEFEALIKSVTQPAR